MSRFFIKMYCICVFLCYFLPQDDYVEALGRLHLTVSRAYRVNPEINFEVFIHKVDGLSDDHKIETQRDIHQRANDDLADASLEKLHLRYTLLTLYYFTSISLEGWRRNYFFPATHAITEDVDTESNLNSWCLMQVRWLTPVIHMCAVYKSHANGPFSFS